MPNHQRGFTLYIILAALVAFGGTVAYGYVQTKRLASVKQEYATFQATVKAHGDAAEKRAREQEKADNERKSKYDKQINVLRRDNGILAGRLRDNAGRSVLPPPSANAGVTQYACFDRGILDGALRAFTVGIAGIVSEGDAVSAELANARAWAASR